MQLLADAVCALVWSLSLSATPLPVADSLVRPDSVERRTLAMTAPVALSLALPPVTGATLLPRQHALALDTVPQPRKKAVVYSDGYGTRLTIHRWLSRGMLPLFAASYFSGDEMLKASSEGREAKSWARSLHGPAATGSAVLFSANTVTGAWNLWEGRGDSNGRVRRLTHAVMFMAASGGFVYAGTHLANEAEQSQAKRRQHRTVALSSMGVATASWLLMLIGN